MHPHSSDLRPQIETLLERAFGRVEERLFESGLIDSLRAIELGVLLEGEFGVPISELDVHDLATVTSIVSKLTALGVTATRNRT